MLRNSASPAPEIAPEIGASLRGSRKRGKKCPCGCFGSSISWESCPNRWHLLPNGSKTRWTRFVEIRWPYPSRSFRKCAGRRSSLRGKDTSPSLRTKLFCPQKSRPFGARRKIAAPKSPSQRGAPRTKIAPKWPPPGGWPPAFDFICLGCWP